MTIKFQNPNALDKVLHCFGKRRAVFLPSNIDAHGYYLAKRENFFRALFRSPYTPLPENWVYPPSFSGMTKIEEGVQSIVPEEPPEADHPTDFNENLTNKSQNDKPSVSSFKSQIKKTLISFLIVLLTIWLVVFVGRSFYDSLIDRIESNKAVHQDKTTLSSGIERQVKDKILLIYKTKNGQLKRVAADKDSLTLFVKNNIEKLEEKRVEILSLVEKSLRHETKKSFSPIYSRIKEYADWYFSYTTTYKILGVAVSSATSHALETGVMPLLDAVAYDVEKYLEEHFEKIVLKPEITDPLFQQSFQNQLQFAHEQFLIVMANLNGNFQQYVAEETTHLEGLKQNEIIMEIDWPSQFHKVSMAGYEKGVGGATVGAGLAVGGALAGKAIGGGVGKVMAGKTLASTAGKSLVAKLSSPFIGKAISIAATTAAGGTIGTFIAGPVGTVIGVGVGVLIDFTLSEGIELVNRETFEKDTRLAIDSFQRELAKRETLNLQKSVNVWFNDTINLLALF
ncbi:MAG: hypothetical protein ACE5FU_12760 [Nitrospinota bacterium]